MDNFYDAPTPPRRGGRGPNINGKQILPVQCKGKRAELHLSKFGNGTNGRSIKYKTEWMTPEEYEQACGNKVRRYLESITTDYGPLKTLTASGMLKPHPKKCKCNVCMDEELTSPELQKKVKREEKREERKDKKEFISSKMEIEKPKPKKRDASSDYDETDGNSARDLALKRKRKPDIPVSEKEESKQVKTPSQSQIVQKPMPQSSSVNKMLSPKPSQPRDKTLPNSQEKSEPSATTPKSTPITTSSPSKPSQTLSKTEIISPATLTTTKPILTSPVTCTPSVSTQSSFSPSSSKPLTSPSFIALTPATNMSPMTTIQSSSSIAPSVVPFPSKLSGIPAPSPTTVSNFSYSTTVHTTNSPSTTTTVPQTTSNFGQVKVESRPVTHAPPPPPSTTKQPVSIAMGPPKAPQDNTIQVMSSMPQTQQQLQMAQLAQNKSGQGRIGSVMQVRCKSVNALLYVNKYESGSKGKCILVGDDWMTPNEYEEKSGSKAKKYLSSIKCLGRPLRAYVNSGELRGTGPPPSPKPPKINKPKPPQPIAPAPAPGQSGPAYAIPPPMSPAHMSAGMPQNLTQVAMMSGVSVGQPIMLSQSNLAVSMAGNSSMTQVGTPILQPMTFTFAPMSAMQGQQLQHQQLQHQQLHGTTVAQQIHGSTDYILQHK